MGERIGCQTCGVTEAELRLLDRIRSGELVAVPLWPTTAMVAAIEHGMRHPPMPYVAYAGMLAAAPKPEDEG